MTIADSWDNSVWRPLIRCVEDWPLAVCDGATVRKSDLVETDHIRRHYTGSTLYLQHNPKQCFYYMSKQGKDDVLIFKQFDSQRDISGQCQYTKSPILVFQADIKVSRAARVLQSPKSCHGRRAEGKYRSTSAGFYVRKRRKP